MAYVAQTIQGRSDSKFWYLLKIIVLVGLELVLEERISALTLQNFISLLLNWAVKLPFPKAFYWLMSAILLKQAFGKNKILFWWCFSSTILIFKGSFLDFSLLNKGWLKNFTFLRYTLSLISRFRILFSFWSWRVLVGWLIILLMMHKPCACSRI